MRYILIAVLAVLVVLALTGPATPGSVDTVVILDTTHDGRGFDWLERVIGFFMANFEGADRLGLLVADGDTFVKHSFGGLDWGGVGDLLGLFESYGSEAAGEGIDGWVGVTTALALYTDAVEDLNIVLASDANRVPLAATMTLDEIVAALGARPGAAVNAVIDHGFDDGSGNAAFALKGDTAWKAVSTEPYWETSEGGFATGGFGADYVSLGFATNGGLFDMKQAVPAFLGDTAPVSFRKGFVNVKVREFGGAPELPQIIPEPSTGILAAAGVVFLGLWHRRRRVRRS